MFELSTLAAFIAVVLGLFIVPGPAVLLTASRTLHSGRKIGIMTGLGIATGDFIHTLFAALGLSAILMTSAAAFNMIKYVGALYLIYLGVKAILDKSKSQGLPVVSQTSSFQSFRQAIMVEVLNPKTSLFFLAFLPQFTDPEKGPLIYQLLFLGLIFVFMSIAYTSMIAFIIRPIGRMMNRGARLGRWSGKLAGMIYIWLGIQVAFQQR